VNNAAEQHPQDSLEHITAEQLERTFRTNIFSYFYMGKAARNCSIMLRPRVRSWRLPVRYRKPWLREKFASTPWHRALFGLLSFLPPSRLTRWHHSVPMCPSNALANRRRSPQAMCFLRLRILLTRPVKCCILMVGRS
jgi:hypothetical protein